MPDDCLGGGAELTTELVHAAARSFNQAHSALKDLFRDIRRLQRHVAELKAAAALPGARVVRVHTPLPVDGAGRPVKRPVGRPKGAKTRVLHVVAPTATAARLAALKR